MSPPDTNIEKQEKQHKAPLIGMPAAIVIATVLFLAVLLWINLYDPQTEVDVNVETATPEEPAADTEGAGEPEAAQDGDAAASGAEEATESE